MTSNNLGKPNVVAYIPARLGSERVLRKNLRPLAGQPLITYAARTALRCPSLDRVYVNTESTEIAAAAALTGVATYMRHPSLAASPVATDEILYDFAKSIDCRTIVVINPTAPFLKSETIQRVLAAFADANGDPTVFTTTRMRRHLIMDDAPRNFEIAGKSPRTQDLTPFDYINFIVFAIARSKVLSQYERRGYCLYAPSLSFVPMAGLECHDIDDEDDFLIAEAIMARNDSRSSMSAASSSDDAVTRTRRL
jgi:CMP-N,N'-diacetyllegionaminic acid synthase